MSPCCTFLDVLGEKQNHTWRVTRIALIFTKSADSKEYRGLVHLDATDGVIWEGLKRLMAKDEEPLPGDAEQYAGLGQVLTAVIYIVTFNWDHLLTEAETHLQALVSYPIMKPLLSLIYYRAKSVLPRVLLQTNSYNTCAIFISSLRSGLRCAAGWLQQQTRSLG